MGNAESRDNDDPAYQNKRQQCVDPVQYLPCEDKQQTHSRKCRHGEQYLSDIDRISQNVIMKPPLRQIAEQRPHHDEQRRAVQEHNRQV